MHGFNPRKKKLTSINLRQIDNDAESWAKKGVIEAASGVFKIDLTKMGYDKLLGTGKVTKKLEIAVKYASPRAQEKVGSAGGKINLPAEKKTAPAEEPAAEKASAEAPAQ